MSLIRFVQQHILYLPENSYERFFDLFLGVSGAYIMVAVLLDHSIKERYSKMALWVFRVTVTFVLFVYSNILWLSQESSGYSSAFWQFATAIGMSTIMIVAGWKVIYYIVYDMLIRPFEEEEEIIISHPSD